MSEIDPISNDFIDEIIKVNQTGVPDPNTTSGEGLRELVKLMRDRFEQETGKTGSWIKMGSVNPAIISEQLPLSYKGDFIASIEKAVIYINGQFHLSGTSANIVNIGTVGAGYRPLTNLSFRSYYGSAAIFVNVGANGLVSLQGADGSLLPVDGAEPYIINLFFRPAITISEGSVVIIAVLPTSIDDITKGASVHLQLTASGGIAPYTFGLKAGDTLPAGLTIDTNGLLSGTALTANSYNFSIVVTDANSETVTRNYVVHVNAPVISVSPVTIGEVTRNSAFSQQITASGGLGNFQFAIASGALPLGLNLSNTGVLSGTTDANAGDYSFTVTATDSGGNPGSRLYSLTVIQSADPTASAPVLINAETNYAGDRITLQFNLPMNNPAGQYSNFSITDIAGAVNTSIPAKSAALHPADNSKIQIVLNGKVSASSSLVRVSYNGTSGNVQSVYNLKLNTLTEQQVTNRYQDTALLTKKMQINLSTTDHPSGLNSWTDVNLTPRLGSSANVVTPVFDVNQVATGYNFTFVENYSADSHLSDIIDITNNTYNNISTNDPVNALFPVSVRATNAVVIDTGPQQLIFALLKADPSKIYNVTATGWQYGGAVVNVLALTGNNGAQDTYHPIYNTSEFAKINNLKPALITLSATSGNAADGYSLEKITFKMSIFSGEKVALCGFIIEECIDN